VKTLNMNEFLGISGFKHFVIKVNNYCNLHCEHCTNFCHLAYNSKHKNMFQRSKWELSIGDLEAFCERFKGIGESDFHHIGSSEPTALPTHKLEEIIDILESYNRKMSLQTNGFGLMNIKKDSINKINKIKLDDHGINSEHISDCRRHLKSFYRGRIESIVVKTHWELTAAMRHPLNKGKKCRLWMRTLSFHGSGASGKGSSLMIYPCCAMAAIMRITNNVKIRDELITAGWAVKGYIIEKLRAWREIIPRYVVEQCENNCWFPNINIGQGGTRITLKKNDIIKKEIKR